MLEVEVKIKTDIEKIASQLEALGFVRRMAEYEKDVYYNGKHEDLREQDKALRIREYRNVDLSSSRYLMNYKGPKVDDITMSREEIEFEIPSLEEGEKLFTGLGFFKAGGVEKTRICYTKSKITCCLDTVTDLGQFLEVEIVTSEDKYDEALVEIENLLNQLGLRIEDTIRESYLCMLQKNDKN